VIGVVSLHDFIPQPKVKRRPPHPDFSNGSGDFAPVPADFATTYNFNPPFNAGYPGQGQAI
jgi:hypothetical protein